jgi:NitT/TauT family transport system substrate-binding protein
MSEPMILPRGFHSGVVLATLGLGLLLAACSPTPAAKPAPPAAPPPAPAVAAPTAAESERRAAPAEPTTVRVFDLQITSSAGNYIGAAQGYFREEGIQLEFIRGNTPDMMAMMASSQIDVGAGAIVAGLYNAFARGIGVKVVGDHGANLPNASAGGLAIRKDLADSGAYQGPADLRGRKLATTGPGTAVELVLDRLLGSAGMGLSDIDSVSLSFPDMMQAFDNRAIEAAYYQEPFTTIAVERGLIVRGPIGYDIYPEQQIGIVLFGEKLLSDRALAVRYMRAYVRGVRDYVRAMLERDPAAFDEVVPILIEYTTVKDRALYEKAIPSGLKPDPIPNVQSIVDDQEWYLARGYQTQRVNVRDFVDTSFVEQAIRELGPARR